MRLVGLVGSVRQGSYNRQLLDAAAKELPADVDFEVWDGLERLPPFNEDVEAGGTPPAVAVWAQQQTRRVLTAIGAQVIDGEVAVPRAHQAFDDQGHLADRDLRGRLSAVLNGLLTAARHTAAGRTNAACCAA